MSKKLDNAEDFGSSDCYMPIPPIIVDEDQIAIDQARKDFPSLFERSIPSNIPAKIIKESTPPNEITKAKSQDQP